MFVQYLKCHTLYYLSIGPSLKSEYEALKEELKWIYSTEFETINTSPLDPESLKNLEKIYVHLALLSERPDEQPESIDYDKLFEILANVKGKSRFVFLGEAGVGKTTLLRKIAYDWAIGERLQHVDLLFFVPLRDVGTNSHFAEIITKYVYKHIVLDNERLDQYMKTNHRKVMILLDGLDENKQDVKTENMNNALVSIIRGDKLNRAPVIVTTRPWRAEQITRVDKLNKRYARVRVEGFKKRDIQVYIQKFFTNDLESADSLIHLVTEESLIAKTMAPFPIFCCMLCHLWKWIKESDRDRVRKLQTFSEVIQEMINALVEQYASKVRDSGESLKDCQARCNNSFEEIGDVAFRGLLLNELAFNEDAFKDHVAAMKTGCEVGVLSSNKKFAPSEIRRRVGREQLSEVSFPHKLLQEYLAGLYLASLYRVNREKFERLFNNKILKSPRQFEYLLYFTTAHGKEPGQAGRPLIEMLCGTLDIKLDEETQHEHLIVEVAFECHDEVAVTLVVDFFLQKTAIQMGGYTEHIMSGYMYIFAACGHKMVIL